MLRFWKTPLRAAGGMLVAAAFAVAQGAVARPGTLNYAEGNVSLGNQTVAPQSLGKVELGQGQVLETTHGKAELLLTPGVVLRVGDDSAVRMLSPRLTDTRVEVLKGEALLEV